MVPTDKAATLGQLRHLLAAAEAKAGQPGGEPRGAERSGGERAGVEQAGTERAGGKRAGGKRHDARRSSARRPQDGRTESGAPSSADANPITDLEQARQIALRRLTTRGRSAAELRSDLIQRAVTPEVADQVIDRLRQVGLVDDAEFAAEWVRSRRGPKALSANRLRAELRAKGVAEPVVDQALAGLGADEAELADALAERRMAAMAGLDRLVIERRLGAQLIRRGFSPAVARRAIDRAWVRRSVDRASATGR